MKQRLLHSDAFEGLSRAGFVARGLIYALIGVLAAALVAGLGGQATNQQGALETVARQPFGRVLLVLIAIGLAGYALWRFVRAALGHGPEGHGDNLVDRLAGLGSGVVYAFLAVVAAKIVVGSYDGANRNVSKHTAGILGLPLGRWIVGGAGVVLVAVGLYQGYRALSREFLDDAQVGQMSPGVRRLLTIVGVAGHLSRMVVFGLIGVFLVKAAIDYDPRTAVGVGGALSRLLREPAGHVLLGVVAVGLIAFGTYSVTDARYHRL